MKWLWMMGLLSLAACSEKKAGSEAGQDKAAEALAKKDETCPEGTVQGCFNAAMEAERRGNGGRAAGLYQQACDAGVPRACTQVGSFVWQGRGVKADPARAYTLYMQGCNGGDAAGCFSAGVCHRTGACAEKNEAEATKLLRRACEGGDKRACDNLGGT